MEKIQEIFNRINHSSSILITAHVDPDGDAVGSSLAMYNYLKENNKNVDICLKNVSKNFSFLSGFNDIAKEENLKNEYDVLIVLDCGSKDRVDIDIGKCKYNELIVIDHHTTHEQFSYNTILDIKACAACQIVYECLKTINANISKQIADCIYTGILTDTGSFRNANVTPKTFEIAKELLLLGVDNNKIAQDILDVMSLNKLELVKIALNGMEFIANKIAFVYLDKETLDKYSKTEGDIHEGIVNYGRNIENIEVSVFVRQLSANEYKVSMRSNRYVDVAKIAQKYDGGGHIRAAGIKYNGDFCELKNILVAEIKKQL